MLFNKNRKIRNFFIYPQFQTRLIIIIMAISLLAPVIILSFQIFSFNQQIKNGQMMNLSETHPYFTIYYQFREQSIYAFSIAVAVSFACAFLIGLVVSHRVAGPLVKLRKHLETVGENPGKDEPLKFREGDFFRELADAYNTKFKKTK
jgi:hypothetical protein